MTMSPLTPPDDLARLLAEVHSARLLCQTQGSQPAATSARSIPARLIWAHARRLPGTPISIEIERAIRQDSDIAQRYRAMMATIALAHAPMAIAASSGAISERRVGGFSVAILEDGQGSVPLLLVRIIENQTAPRLLELRGQDDTVRIGLQEPVENTILLSLDPANPEAAAIERLIRDPTTEIYFV
jgi:hypothetical protein